MRRYSTLSHAFVLAASTLSFDATAQQVASETAVSSAETAWLDCTTKQAAHLAYPKVHNAKAAYWAARSVAKRSVSACGSEGAQFRQIVGEAAFRRAVHEQKTALISKYREYLYDAICEDC